MYKISVKIRKIINKFCVFNFKIYEMENETTPTILKYIKKNGKNGDFRLKKIAHFCSPVCKGIL